MADLPPLKNAAYILYTGLVQQADTKLLKAAPTLAAGDFKVSTDGGAFANLATLPTVTPAAGTALKISLSAGEMNGDNIVITCIDAAGAEWCDQLIEIQTASVRQLKDLAFPATTGRSMVVDAAGLVDANMVKAGPTGSGTVQTAGDIIGDTNDLQTRLPAALTADGNIKADTLRVGGTLQTARDVGASVLLSSGTGTGQLDFTSGVVKGNLAQILGTALTETAGLLAAGFKKFFNVATPTGTINSIPDAVAGAASGLALVGSNVGAATSVSGAVGSVTGNVGGNVVGSVASVTAGVTVTTNNDKTGYGLSAAAVQAIWDALTSALTAVGSIGKLLVDNINATISSRLAGASYTAPLDAASTRAAVGLATANLDTQLTTIDDFLDTEVAAILAAVDTEVAAIKAKTDLIPASPAAVGSAMTLAADAVSAAALAADASAEIVAAIAAMVIEGAVTLKQSMQLANAANAGKVSGAATATVLIRDLGDTKNRLTASVDASGNRSAVTPSYD